MSRKLAIGLAVLACATLVPMRPASAEVAWKDLPYIHWGASPVWGRVSTSDLFNGAVEINSAETIVKTPTDGYPYGYTVEEQNDDNHEVVWASTCQATDAQTVRFRRQIYLPGTAKKLLASIGAWSAKPRDNPISRIEIRVNGSTVHQELATRDDPIATYKNRDVVRVSPALRYGLNTIEFFATKRRTPASDRFCSSYKFGIVGELYGEFVSDVRISPVKVVHNNIGVQYEVTVTNLGPSAVPGPVPPTPFARIYIEAQVMSGNVQIDNNWSSADGYTCANYGHSTERIYDCDIVDLPAGEAKTLTAVVFWNYASSAPYCIYGFASGGGIGEVGTPLYTNNVRQGFFGTPGQTSGYCAPAREQDNNL